jgi:type IV secretion system protein VirD4
MASPWNAVIGIVANAVEPQERLSGNAEIFLGLREVIPLAQREQEIDQPGQREARRYAVERIAHLPRGQQAVPDGFAFKVEAEIVGELVERSRGLIRHGFFVGFLPRLGFCPALILRSFIQPCIYLNPFGLLGLPNTPINPLQTLVDIIASGGEIDTQADEIAQILLPPAPKDGGNGWVRKGALRLLATRMEYLAHCEPDQCNLGGLWRFVNASTDDLDKAFMMMETCGIEGIARRAGALRATFVDAPKQFEAYKSEGIEALNPFEPGKTLERATRSHGFDFARLKHVPHTVYLITPSEKLGVIAPWISLIVNYAIEAIAREPGQLRTCFILDEFPQLPPAPAILKALRLYRGRGIQLWIFSQGRFSMESRWSREAVKEFEDQAAIFTMTGVEDPDLLRDVEKWSGNRTIVTHGLNVGVGAVESAGTNRSEARRPVLQSEDIRAVGAGKQIIKVAGVPPLFVCDRLPFYTVEPWKDQIGDVRDLHKGVT